MVSSCSLLVEFILPTRVDSVQSAVILILNVLGAAVLLETGLVRGPYPNLLGVLLGLWVIRLAMRKPWRSLRH